MVADAHLPRLIVEADNDVAELMMSQLTDDHTTVGRVSTLREALAATDHDLAVVVLNLDLPDSQGTATYYAFTAERPDHPVLVVSDHPREPIGHELIRAGATEVVDRTCIADGLLRLAVHVAVTRWERRRHFTDLTVDSGILTARLSSVGPLLEQAEERIGRLVTTLRESSDDRLNELAPTVADVRASFRAATPLSDAGIAPWLASLVAMVDAAGPRVIVECEVSQLPPDVDRHVRAATQELLANAIKHADATVVTIEIQQAGREVRVQVTDDGRGLGDSTEPGHGLFNLERRASRLGGGLRHRRTGGRTRIDWWVPLAGTG